MYIAVKDRKVIAYGSDFGKVYGEARRKVGEDFIMDYTLPGEPLVLNVKFRITCKLWNFIWPSTSG